MSLIPPGVVARQLADPPTVQEIIAAVGSRRAPMMPASAGLQP
jgi:hypothetical protein